MGNRCGFQDQWDSFARILLSNSPATFGGSPRRPLMYCTHEDKAGSAVLKKPPKISLAQTDACFSLLLCVPRGLAGDSALCQLHSGIHVDGEAPIWTKAGYHGWLPWLGNRCHLECHKLLPLTFSWPNQSLCSCPSSTGCGKHSSSRWSEEDDQILVSSPTSVTSISQPKTHPPHLCP